MFLWKISPQKLDCEKKMTQSDDELGPHVPEREKKERDSGSQSSSRDNVRVTSRS